MAAAQHMPGPRTPEMHRFGHGLHILWRSHFEVDEHPFAYFDVQRYRVLTHSHFGNASLASGFRHHCLRSGPSR